MNVKEILKTALNLVVFCVIVGFLLSFANGMTLPKIQENERKAKEEVQKVLLPADKYEPVPGIPEVTKAIKDGKFIGYLVEATAKGYSSDIKLMYSLSSDFKVQGVNIISQNETPGLGTRVDENDKISQFGNQPFVAQFKGKGLDALKIGTSSSFNDDSIAAITGATISSRAVTKGVHDSLAAVEEKLKSQKNTDEAAPGETPEMTPTPDKTGESPSGNINEDKPLSGAPAEAAGVTLPEDLKALLPCDTYSEVYPGAYKGVKDGKVSGYIVKGSSKGYKSVINVAFSVNPKMEIVKVAVVKHDETPKFAQRFENPRFLNQFSGKTLKTLVLKKGAGVSPNHIDAATGATISSRAVVLAVRDGLEKLVKFSTK